MAECGTSSVPEAYIDLISREDARRRRPPDHAYNPGVVPAMGRLLMTHPRIGPALEVFQTELMFGEGQLDRTEREILAVVASVAQDCDYCTSSHAEFLRVEGLSTEGVDAIVEGRWRESDALTPRQLALCEVAEKLTLNPTRFVPADWLPLRDLGLDDIGLLEVAHVVGYFNYVTRLADGFGLMIDPDLAH